MTARLLAVLALVMIGLVVPASPAAACSCVGIEQVVGDDPEVSFVGVLKLQKADDSKIINRFTVRDVYAGQVHATQDVVSPVDDTCSVEWSEGERVLVLGSRNDDEQIATNLCTYVVEGADEYDDAVASLGEPTAPLAGSEFVERDGFRRSEYLWLKLVFGSIGFAVLGVSAVRWFRGRRA